MDADARHLAEAVRRLVDEYRDRCLWFLRRDYRPEGDEETLRTLGALPRIIESS